VRMIIILTDNAVIMLIVNACQQANWAKQWSLTHVLKATFHESLRRSARPGSHSGSSAPRQ